MTERNKSVSTREKVLGKKPKSTVASILAAALLVLWQFAAVSGTRVPVVEDGAPVFTDDGELVFEDAPPFDPNTVPYILGILGVGRWAGED